MKAVKEERLGQQGAFAFLSMNKSGPGKQRVSLEEALKDLGLALAALAAELRMEGRGTKVIPARLTEDKLVLVFPGTTREAVADLAGRLMTACDRRARMTGRPESGFRLTVLAYGPGEKKLTAFLQLLFSQFTAGVSSQEEWRAAADGFMAGLAEHIAESFMLLDQAQKLALSDDVSGLPNHRAAQTVLGEKFNYSLKKQAPFSILFIDGDNLRQYNSISYQKGNSMIRRLGEILASQLRRGDFLARWFSGDEFLVVLPGADRDEAYRVGERLRVLVE